MKKLITILFICLSILAHAIAMAGPCGNYEYAELQDMDQPTFIKEYCKVMSDGRVYAGVVMGRRTRQSQADFDSCYELMKKMERIYMKKFKVEDEKEMKKLCEKSP